MGELEVWSCSSKGRVVKMWSAETAGLLGTIRWGEGTGLALVYAQRRVWIASSKPGMLMTCTHTHVDQLTEQSD